MVSPMNFVGTDRDKVGATVGVHGQSELDAQDKHDNDHNVIMSSETHRRSFERCCILVISSLLQTDVMWYALKEKFKSS